MSESNFELAVVGVAVAPVPLLAGRLHRDVGGGMLSCRNRSLNEGTAMNMRITIE